MRAAIAKPSNKKKIIISVLIALFLIIGVGIGYAAYLYNKTDSIVSDAHEDVGRDNETSQLRMGNVDPVEDNVSVLFIGVDDSEHREVENSRSDALLLATFNQEQSTVKLLSIPRDTYVYVPEVNYATKINHAHSFGGPRATIETIEEFLDVPVDYYVRMNFNAFVDVVDALDGIWLNVPYEILESDSDDKRDSIHLYPGYQQLDGEQALALARTRKYDNDVERGKRQQEILTEIANKATSASSLFKLEDVIVAVGTNLRTNLTFGEIRSFLSYGLDEGIQIENVNFSGQGGYMEAGGWFYQVDEESRIQIQTELRNHLELEPLGESIEYAEPDDNLYQPE
ncbi:LCP family protein [Oceanobacillus saliphilus]|uniref:LCP family protein n=1 Tax=Oceanobacillus saliphilus TaxID=2925834 RepID=UPI00201E1DDE|nr:LCP family protein [Oceanobacillus saliphilus]